MQCTLQLGRKHENTYLDAFLKTRADVPSLVNTSKLYNTAEIGPPTQTVNYPHGTIHASQGPKLYSVPQIIEAMGSR